MSTVQSSEEALAASRRPCAQRAVAPLRTRAQVAGALALLSMSSAVAAAESGGLRHDPFAWPAAVRAPAPAPMFTGTAAAVAATPAPAAPWEPRLRAVVVAGGRSMALVNGSVVAIGEQIDGFRLVRVQERTATFEKNGQHVELKMDGGNAATR